MKTNIYQIILLILFAGIINSCEKPDPKGNITGTVKDESGNAIENASISISSSNSDDSNVNGKFEFKDLTPDSYTLTITEPDYKEATKQVTVTDGQTKEVEIILTKKQEKPTISSQDIGNIGENSATVIGNITNLGSSEITAHGHCWNTSGAATINSSKINYGTKTTTGEYTSNLTGLSPNTTYYVRAFATNNAGTVYSDEKTFKTFAENAIPDVTTNAAINIAATTATLGGNVTSAGNSSITERGVCWSTSNNPNISNDHKAASAAGVGNFSVNVTNLISSTTYYVKAYATNTTGTAYGEEKTFIITNIPAPTSTTNTASSITTNGSTLNATINANGNEATVTFEYGTTTFYGSATNATPNTVTGSTNTNVNAAISGLNQNATYHFRVKAVNTGGTTYGDDLTFTTTANSIPTLTTNAVTNISFTTATSGGNISSDGNASVTARGVCWSTNNNPTLSDAHTTDGSGTGNFTSNLTNLTANTTYYVRAYAENSVGTAYGNEESFTTEEQSTGSTITDYDGNTYNTVTIGEQTWMAENFKGTHDKNGRNLTSYAYDNNESNVATYGKLYTWNEAMKGAPEGWHLPTDEEWKELEIYLGGKSTAGGKMKETGNLTTGDGLWTSPNTGATNSSGFNASPGGNRHYISGAYENKGDYAAWWSSTENFTNAWRPNLYYTESGVASGFYSKNYGLSVRYIKDSEKTVQDIDGNIYDVVTIGSQQWMKQNLKVTKYSNGAAIPHVTDNTAWTNLGDNNTDKAYCYYDNDLDNKATYGNLYTWAAATNGVSSASNPSGVQGACPDGWHVPSDTEWTELVNYLGGESVAGGKMKTTGDLTTGDGLWTSPNTGATNSSGFSALPGGIRFGSIGDDDFYSKNSFADYISSTQKSTSTFNFWFVSYDNVIIQHSGGNKSFGNSIRCIKD